MSEAESKAIAVRPGSELERLRARVAELETVLDGGLEGDPHARLVVALLRALDDLERALAATAAAPGDAGRAIADGVELVAGELRHALAADGVEPIPVAPGDGFDPIRHATLAATAAPLAGGVVAEELRRGWRRGVRVLRPALVRLDDDDPGTRR